MMNKVLFTLLMLATISCFTGCQKDDGNDDNAGKKAQSLLTGQWYLTQTAWQGEANGQPQSGRYDYEIVENEYTEFRSDGTFADLDNNSSYPGKYSVSEDGKTLNMFYDTEGDEVYTIKTLTSSTLILTYTHTEEATMPAPEGNGSFETVTYTANYTDIYQRK